MSDERMVCGYCGREEGDHSLRCSVPKFGAPEFMVAAPAEVPAAPDSRAGVVTCSQRYDSDWSRREVRVIGYRSGKWGIELHTEALNSFMWLSAADVESLLLVLRDMTEFDWPEVVA